MIYDYYCSRCWLTFEVVKPASQLEWRTECPDCGQATTKLLTFNGQVNAGNFEPHFNWAFGEEIHTKRGLREAKRRYEGEHGTELYEVGNERPKLKPQRKAYTIGE